MYQSYLQNCYQTVLTNIVCNEEPLLEAQISDLISSQIIDSFKWRQDVNEEAFIVISSLSNMYKRDFSPNIERFYDFIDFGLQQKTSSGIVRNTCGLIADLCVNECADYLIEKLDCIMPKVFELLSDTNVDRTVKIRSITNIGDLLAVAGDRF